MEIILLEKIHRLGDLGEQVSVAGGYGRNYLIPQGKAVSATARNKKIFEQRRSELEGKAVGNLQAAEARAEKFKALGKITIEARANDEGKLFGSVGVHEIIKAIQDKDIEVAKREIRLPDGVIHQVGEYPVHFQFHSDVLITLNFEIVPAKAS